MNLQQFKIISITSLIATFITLILIALGIGLYAYFGGFLLVFVLLNHYYFKRYTISRQKMIVITLLAMAFIFIWVNLGMLALIVFGFSA